MSLSRGKFGTFERTQFLGSEDTGFGYGTFVSVSLVSLLHRERKRKDDFIAENTFVVL